MVHWGRLVGRLVGRKSPVQLREASWPTAPSCVTGIPPGAPRGLGRLPWREGFQKPCQTFWKMKHYETSTVQLDRLDFVFWVLKTGNEILHNFYIDKISIPHAGTPLHAWRPALPPSSRPRETRGDSCGGSSMGVELVGFKGFNYDDVSTGVFFWQKSMTTSM